MDNILKFDSINIELKTAFGSVMSLKHEFVFKTQSETGFFSMGFKFSLPESAVISGFEIKGGGFSVKSAAVSDNTESGNAAVCLTQLSSETYMLKMNEIPDISAGFSFIVKSTVIMKYDLGSYVVALPLYTVQDISRTEYRSDLEAVTSVNIRAEISGRAERVYSPTHSFDVSSAEKGVVLTSTVKSGGVYKLCVDKSPQKSSIGYICKKENDLFNRGYYCIYDIVLHGDGNRVENNSDMIFIMDITGGTEFAKNAVRLAVFEFVSSVDTQTRFMLSSLSGEIFSKNFQRSDSETRDRIKDRLKKADASGINSGINSDNIITEMLNIAQNADAQIIFITSSGLLSTEKELRDKIISSGIRFNIVSLAEELFSGSYEKLASAAGGTFGRIDPGHDFGSYAVGFLSAVGTQTVKNMTITQYAAGTYYMVPYKIDSYVFGTPITLSLGTETEYPDEFIFQGDGGFFKKIKIEEIQLLEKEEAVSRAFARLTLDELYKLMSRSDIAAESLTKLKKQAAALAAELNVLCPENKYSALVACNGKEAQGPLLLTLKYTYDDESKSAMPVFMDLGAFTVSQSERIINRALGALMFCVRLDGSITTPYEYKYRAKQEQTAYAYAAIKTAAERGHLKSVHEYDDVLAAAREYTEADGFDIERFPIVYDSLEVKAYNSIIESLDVKEISRLILTLICGFWM